jgi:hypothetical protein
MLEGFRGRGDEIYQQAVKDDLARRDMEGKLFTHLLGSRDPEIRALALQGMYEGAQPTQRKKGWRGFLGEIQQSSTFPQIQQLADQLVPDEPPTPQSTPASAAMSTNAPVEPGSAPITPPAYEEQTSYPRVGGGVALTPIPPHQGAPTAPTPIPAAPEGPPQTQPLGQGTPPPAGPVGFHKRGTQVPTAEEIAEYQARIPTETRIGLAKKYLPEEEAKRAIMGVLGAPQANRQFAAPTFAVEDPVNGNPVPVAFDYSTGRFYFTDGTPVPRGAKFVQMSRGAGGAGLTSTIRDTPQLRAEYGIGPEEVTPSGYWKVKQLPDGSYQYVASEYTPPPAFGGTTTVLEGGTGVPVRAGVPRGGGKPVPLGDEPSTEPARVQQAAQGLLAAVDKILLQEQVGPGGMRKAVPPARMDAVVKEQAVAQGLPYQSYAELQQAAKVKPKVTPRQEVTQDQAGMSMADRVRARALKPLGGAPPAPAPQKPSARAVGPGPGR